MKLSQKKERELADVIYDDILEARIKIAKLTNKLGSGSAIDDVLYDLCQTAPHNAICVFRDKQKKK